jgi:hypothetical protein
LLLNLDNRLRETTGNVLMLSMQLNRTTNNTILAANFILIILDLKKIHLTIDASATAAVR